jgi:hypothetical protein
LAFIFSISMCYDTVSTTYDTTTSSLIINFCNKSTFCMHYTTYDSLKNDFGRHQCWYSKQLLPSYQFIRLSFSFDTNTVGKSSPCHFHFYKKGMKYLQMETYDFKGNYKVSNQSCIPSLRLDLTLWLIVFTEDLKKE